MYYKSIYVLWHLLGNAKGERKSLFPHAQNKNLPSAMSMRNMKCQFENQGERWTKIKHRSSARFWLCLLWAVSSTPGKSHIRIKDLHESSPSFQNVQIAGDNYGKPHPSKFYSPALLWTETRKRFSHLIPSTSDSFASFVRAHLQLYETSLEFWTL